MPKRGSSVSLSKLNAGLNRYEREAAADACVSSLNVWERRGDLVRRPAFAPVAHAPAYLLPAGACQMWNETLGSPPTGGFSIPGLGLLIHSVAAQIGNGNLWFGCEYRFDGISIPPPYPGSRLIDITSNMRLAPRYWNGTELVPIYGSIDTTRAKVTNGNDQWEVPFQKGGTLAFDSGAFVDWEPVTLFDLPRALYWITLDLTLEIPEPGTTPLQRTYPGTDENAAGLILRPPGLRAFKRGRVNGIFPSRAAGRAAVTVVGGDIHIKTGLTGGCGLGFVATSDGACETAREIEDFGSCIAGTLTDPLWAGGSGSVGAAGATAGIEKSNQSYEWYDAASGIAYTDTDQFQGAPVLRVESDGVGSTYGPLRIVPVASGWMGSYTEEDFIGLRLVVIENLGVGGMTTAAASQYSEIVKVTDTAIYICGPTALSNGVETFEVRKQPAFLRIDKLEPDYEVDSNTAHVATIIQRDFCPTIGPNSHSIFELAREYWRTYGAGRQWSFLYNSNTGRTVGTNGVCPLIEFDGQRFKRLESLWDENEGVFGAGRVSAWRGILRDNPGANLTDIQALESASQVLRSPPQADFVCDFNGHIVTARENRVRWSARGDYWQIWPINYGCFISDSENGPITGIRTVGEKLCVFTAASIHVSPPPNEYGELAFVPAVQGIGFLSQQGTCAVGYDAQPALMGVTVDGIKAFDGQSIIDVVDSWDRLLGRGVNVNCLDRAVCTYWRAENLFLAAVASAGSGVNDRLIVLDVSGKKAWVWSAPVSRYTDEDEPIYDGISAIASDVDELGREFILFGHESGMITSLFDADKDMAGTEIRWYARSKEQNFEGRTVACQGVMMQFEASGSIAEIEVKALLSQNSIPAQALTLILEGASGDSEYGTAYFGSGSQYASKMLKTYRGNLKSGVVRGEGFAYEIAGTKRFRFTGAELLLSTKGFRGY